MALRWARSGRLSRARCRGENRQDAKHAKGKEREKLAASKGERSTNGQESPSRVMQMLLLHAYLFAP